MPHGDVLQLNDDYIKELERVLKMAQYELITLNPRLTEQYRRSVRAVLNEIDKVLKLRKP